MDYSVKYNSTAAEKAILDRLPEELRTCSEVSIDYRELLKNAYDNLQHIYGDLTNPVRNLEKYYNAENSCKIVTDIEDIPLLSTEDLMEMIEEEKLYTERLSSFEHISFSENIPESERGEELLRLSEWLGLNPKHNEICFNEWFVDFPVEPEAVEFLKEKIQHNRGTFEVAVSAVCKFYVDGVKETFPVVGTTMMQPRRKYFFRGENAFYGSSRPSIFRGIKSECEIELFLRKLRINECGTFLDGFDSVRSWHRWNDCNENHLAIMQHYGLRTPMMDVTSDIKVALFFACCEWNGIKWQPLTEEKIINKVSRKSVAQIGGDSRFGILYRCPQDVMDLKWLINDNQFEGMIIPVGYQPFMRCKTQSAYMLMANNIDFDLYKYKDFEKFRFLFTKDLCKWIYEEMDQGDAIYPKNDIPNIEKAIAKVNETRRFSTQMFLNLTEEWGKNERATCLDLMKKHQAFLVDGTETYISPNELRKINKRYPVGKAIELTGVDPKSAPIIEIH